MTTRTFRPRVTAKASERALVYSTEADGTALTVTTIAPTPVTAAYLDADANGLLPDFTCASMTGSHVYIKTKKGIHYTPQLDQSGKQVLYHATVQAATLVKAGPCKLHDVVINTTTAVTASISIYDVATSGAAGAGNLLAVIDGTVAGLHKLDFDLYLGLVVAVVGATTDATISYTPGDNRDQ